MAIVTRFTLENATAEVQGVTLTYGEVLAKFFRRSLRRRD